MAAKVQTCVVLKITYTITLAIFISLFHSQKHTSLFLLVLLGYFFSPVRFPVLIWLLLLFYFFFK